MKTRKDIFGFIFTLATLVVLSLNVQATTYYSISNTEWSTTPNGAPMSGNPFSVSGGANNVTDSLIIAHDVSINKMKLSSYIKVLDGASLTLVGNGFGARVELAGYLDVDFGGTVYANASDFEIIGTANINGAVYVNSKADFDNNITGEGVVYVSNNDIDLNNANVNGTALNQTWNDTTVFLGTYDSSLNNVVWFYNGDYSDTTTDCSTEFRVMSNYNSSAARTVGKLVVKGNTNLTVENNTTLNVCQDVVNNGYILVKAGSSIVVQGN